MVAAPSKLTRPAGDRIKTDAKDAMLLARLLRMDEITAVRVPNISQEAASCAESWQRALLASARRGTCTRRRTLAG